MRQHYYYISSGAKNCFYTLRSVYKAGKRVHDEYHQNLSIDWQTALEKVSALSKEKGIEIHGTVEPFPLNDFTRRSAVWEFTMENTNPYILPFGKYATKDFREVNDDNYLMWMLDALSTKNAADTRNYENVVVRVALAIHLAGAIEKRDADNAEREAAKKAEYEAAEDVPEGKVKITGTVLATKMKDNDWGSTLKMLVKDHRGFKVWGTVPSRIKNLKERDVRGLEISFMATLARSDDDTKFGFFKRPTKCEAV